MGRIASKIRVTDTDGTVVDHFARPLDGYEAADNEIGDTSYYGYLDKDGNWYIMKRTSTAVTYAKGITAYSTNWTNRASLSYDYFDQVF